MASPPEGQISVLEQFYSDSRFQQVQGLLGLLDLRGFNCKAGI